MSDMPKSFTDKEPAVDARNVHGGVETTQAPERPRHAPYHSPTLPSAHLKAESHMVAAVVTEEQSANTRRARLGVGASQSAAVTVLQWLTYIFWGCTLMAVVYGVLHVAAAYVGTSVPPWLPDERQTIIAVTVSLLLISLVLDTLYSRREQFKKTGIGMVLAVVYSVAFALISLGFLLVAGFAVFHLATDGGSTSDSTWLLGATTAAAGTLLFGLLFLRTLNSFRSLRNGFFFSLCMVMVTAGVVTAAVVGPAAYSESDNEDKRFVGYVHHINTAIQEYATTKNKLPHTLSDAPIRDAGARALVNKGVVTYVPGDTVASTEYKGSGRSSYSDYRYELCATYVHGSTHSYAKKDAFASTDADGFTDVLDVSFHPAGKVCYKLKATITGGTADVNVQTMKL